MISDLEIIPGHGLDTLMFGLSKKAVTDILGTPDAVNDHKEVESGKTVVLFYVKKGMTLYFEEEDDYCLSCIEIENPDMVFSGEKIFKNTIDQIKELLKKNSFKISSEEYVNPVENKGKKKIKEEDLEFSISVDDIETNFYFFEERLLSVQFGVLFDENDEISWPE